MSAELQRRQTGPDEAPERSPSLMALVPPALKQTRLLLATVVLCLIAQFATVLCFATCGWLAGQALVGAPTATLDHGIAVLVGAVVLASLGRWLLAYVSHDFAFALIETLQLGVFDGLERAAPAYLFGRSTGELASVATGDAELIETFYAHMLADYLAAAFVPLVALAVLFEVQWPLALTLLPFLVLLASVPLWLAQRADAQGRRLAAVVGRLNGEVVEFVQGIKELVIFGAAQKFMRKIMDSAEEGIVEQRRFGMRAGLEQAAIDGLLASALIAVALVDAWLWRHGRIGVAALPLTISLAGASVLPVAEVTQTARRLGELKAAASRVLVATSTSPSVVDSGHGSHSGDMTVTFDRVRFGYGQGRATALDEVSFRIRPGEVVALVGASGAGKSTCANLLLRIWDAQRGRISIGDTDICDLPLSTLRTLVATVPQDIYLFNASISDNIRLGRPDATEAEVEEAARLAQAHGFISALPRGYATRCGERSVRLSGGQRQRIAIARALLMHAPIIVMDEASSHLDPQSEAAIQSSIEKIRGQRTLILIAHRPSTIRAAERVLRLENGSVHEDATMPVAATS